MLAMVFAIASLAKFRSPASTKDDLNDLGLPKPKMLARILPIAELVTAALLIVYPVVGGVTAVALIATFTTLLLGKLRSGQTKGCACFGSWSKENLSYWDISRNVVLAILGGVAVFG